MKCINREQYHIGRFDIMMDTLENNGKIGPYSYIVMKPSICVLTIVNEKILLMKEYRYPIDSWEYEFPCGMIEKNEEPIEAAYRELLEETGYTAENIESLGYFYPSFGSTTEKIYLFVAHCNTKEETSLDVLENMECTLVEEDEINQMIKEGTISCGAAIIAWYRYKN